MARFQITSPTGRKYEVEAPDGATEDEVMERVRAQDAAEDDGGKTPFTNVLTGKPITLLDPHKYGLSDLAVSKTTFGLSDKAMAGARAGVGGAIDAATGRDEHQPYRSILAKQDADRAAYKEANPGKDWATLPLNFTGAAPAATRLPAWGAGAVSGLQGGAVAGFGGSRGELEKQAIDTAVGGAVGMGLGAGIGYVAPKVYGAVEKVVRRVSDKLKDKSPSQAYEILLKTMQQDGIDPAQAAQMLDDARARGVPLSLSDTGDNMRGLTSSLARKPGDARVIVRGAMDARQAGQAERIQGAVQRDLGPTTNIRKTSEAIMEGAKAKAAPLYDEAYSVPVSWTNEPGTSINKILGSPAGKGALRKAYTIAANELDDPLALGFNLDANGEVVLQKVPSMKTLDYVKRGLDDVVEQYRDPTSGRLNLDTNGRAVNNLRSKFVAELRKINPKYGEALDAYGGDARMAVALKKGKTFANKSADDIMAEIERLSPAEVEQYKLGVRSAISEFVEGRPDGGDKVRALIGSPKKRKALSELFGGEKRFNNFIAMLDDEAKAFQTYARSMTGSPTAANVADDSNLEGLANLADAAVSVKGGRYVNAARILFGRKGAADKISEGTRTQLAEALTNGDPAAFREAMRQVTNLRTQAGDRLIGGKYLGASAGFGSGNLMSRFLVGDQ